MNKNSYTIIIWLLIPLVLLVISLYQSNIIFQKYNLGPLIISNEHNNIIPIEIINKPIYKGNIISGILISDKANLAAISIRFFNHNRINEDSVIFRIKEKNTSNWYYENTYRTDQFLPDHFFHFGFPTIPDSNNKEFYFEIESINGQEENAISLSKKKPLILSQYQLTKEELVKKPQIIPSLTIDNFRNIINSPSSQKEIVTILLPFYFYTFLILLSFLIKKLLIIIFHKIAITQIKSTTYYIFIATLIYFITQNNQSLKIIYILIIVWLFIDNILKYQSKHSIIIGLYLLFIATTLTWINDTLTPVFSGFACVFLSIGTIKKMIEFK